MATTFNLGTGWRPDPVDPRDATREHAEIQPLLQVAGLGALVQKKPSLPTAVDHSDKCGPVRFQGGYNTCTAFVATGMIEFLERYANDTVVEGSPLFIYKVVKNLLGETGNVGVYLRQAMGALTLVGIPPEKFWPYLDAGTLQSPVQSDPRIDDEPGAFCYAIARDYRSVKYYRLDSAGVVASKAVLHQAKAHVASGFPLSLGIKLYKSFDQSMTSGGIPMPAQKDDPELAGHAVLIVGYDDEHEITNTLDGESTVGAFRIQNSWSEAWGQKGFGWVPYEYLTTGLANDVWTITRAEWIDTGRFQLDL